MALAQFGQVFHVDTGLLAVAYLIVDDIQRAAVEDPLEVHGAVVRCIDGVALNQHMAVVAESRAIQAILITISDGVADDVDGAVVLHRVGVAPNARVPGSRDGVARKGEVAEVANRVDIQSEVGVGDGISLDGDGAPVLRSDIDAIVRIQHVEPRACRAEHNRLRVRDGNRDAGAGIIEPVDDRLGRAVGRDDSERLVDGDGLFVRARMDDDDVARSGVIDGRLNGVAAVDMDLRGGRSHGSCR